LQAGADHRYEVHFQIFVKSRHIHPCKQHFLHNANQN